VHFPSHSRRSSASSPSSCPLLSKEQQIIQLSLWSQNPDPLQFRKGHNASLSDKFRVYTSGQKRRMTPVKREMTRRAAIEAVIGQLKNDHRMARNYLAHQAGDPSILSPAAASYNFHLLLTWLRLLLSLFLSTAFGQQRPIVI
jgi:hypothetical protein